MAWTSQKAPRGSPGLTSPSNRRIAINSITCLLNIIYCGMVWNLIEACDVQSSPEVENFQIKIYYPARDWTPDLLNQRQTCYHLSQRGSNNIPQQFWAYIISQDGVEHAHASRILAFVAASVGEAFLEVCLSGCFPFSAVDGCNDMLNSRLIHLTTSRSLSYITIHAEIVICCCMFNAVGQVAQGIRCFATGWMAQVRSQVGEGWRFFFTPLCRDCSWGPLSLL